MPRNRNRQPGPIRRTVIATRPDPTVGTSPALRTPDRAVFTGPGPKIGRATGGGMRSGDNSGAMSDWHRTANLRVTSTPMTRAWSQTVSDQTV